MFIAGNYMLNPCRCFGKTAPRTIAAFRTNAVIFFQMVFLRVIEL